MHKGGRGSSYRPSYPHDDEDRDRDYMRRQFQDRINYDDEEQRLAFVRERDEKARLARAERFAMEAREIGTRGAVPPHTPTGPRSSIPSRVPPTSSRLTAFSNSINQTASRTPSTAAKHPLSRSPLDSRSLPQKKVKKTVDSYVATDNRIHVTVGKDEDKKTLALEKELLLGQSLVIRAEAVGEGREVTSSQLCYPDIKPHYYGILLAWIETQDIDRTQLTELVDKAAGLGAWQICAKTRWNELVECSMVAQKLQASAFHNAIVDEMMSLGRAYTQDFDVQDLIPEAELWQSIYGSAVGDLCIDLFVSRMKPKTLEKMLWREALDGIGKHFMGCLMMKGFHAMQKPSSSSATAPWQKVPCPYYKDFAAAGNPQKR